MKNLIAFIVFSLLGLVLLPAQTYQTSRDYLDKGFKRYQHESGHIVYNISGSATGSEELFFDRFGWRESKYGQQTMKVFGIKTESEKIDLLDGEYQVSIDVPNKRATGMKNPLMDNLVENAEDGNLTTAGIEMMESLGGTQIGVETVLGRECEVWELASLQTKTWIWEGIPLKTQSNLMGIELVIEAVELELDIPIDPEKFKIPADVKISKRKQLAAFGH